MRRFQRHIFVPILLVFSLISAASGQGFWANTVLCVSGADHAAFEPGQNGRCLPAPRESRASRQTDEISPGTGCDPCSDFPVFGDPSYRQQSEGDPIPDHSPLSSLQEKIPDAFSPPAHFSPRATPFPSPTLLSLRTQILLI
jgi:hypothetical protein